MAIDSNKYQILIDGTDYATDRDGELPFQPVIKRDKKYHSPIAKFSEERIEFTGAAADYLRTQKERGLFVTSTFVVKVYDYYTDTYATMVNGSIDYKTFRDEEVLGKVSILFAPDDAEQTVKKRATILTELGALTDFNGTAITPFTNETITVSVTDTNIDGYTEAGPTNVKMMLAWEVFLRLAQKILGRDDALRSDLIGRTDAEVYTSPSDGRLAFVALTNGGQIRGGSLGDYPITISLDEAFDWLNSIEPIGMGVEYFDGVPFIVVEEIDYFYRQDTPIIDITNPSSVTIATAPDRVYGRILSGYRNFKTGEDGFTEKDIHTTRRWVTGLDNISDEAYNIRTNIVASPLLVEILKNAPISNGESNEADEWLFTFELKRGGGGGFEIDNSTGVTTTGIDNDTTYKNYLFAPVRAIKKHIKVIQRSPDKRVSISIGPNPRDLYFSIRGGQ